MPFIKSELDTLLKSALTFWDERLVFMIDIEKLRAANEAVQAVGNMNVNAKGDVLGAGGKVVTKKETVTLSKKSS